MKARRKLRQTKSHAVTWVVVILILAIGTLAVRGAMNVVAAYGKWTDNLPEIDTSAFNYAKESYMYAADGETLLANFQLEKRVPITIDEMNSYVINGTVAVEDVRFYEHDGVDIQGIVRAVLNNITGGELEGASTITQQLIRNTTLSEEANDITLERKAREAELALEMEKQYSKEEILTMYLNTINYGDGCYGIEAAANNYYQVSAKDLTLAQAATLIGIPQSPTRLNPKFYPQACLERRNHVLDRMLAAGYITQAECDAAKAEDLNLNPAPDEPYQGIYAYPYFTSYVRDELLKENNKYGCSYADLFAGGLRIYTTLDVDMQEKAEEACEWQYDMMEDGLDCALVAMDPRTGYVLAIVGGKDFYTDQWNVATQGGRPSGSTFKVFTLTAAIESGINPTTVIDCTNPAYPEGGGDPINNFGGANYGRRSIISATAVSSNTGYFRLAEFLGATKIIDTAHRMGIDSDLSPYPIITLGTENVTPLEMAEAYSTLATGGIHHEPVVITRIENSEGKVLYEAEVTDDERILSEEVAGAVTSVLRGVFESGEGTAAGMGPSNGQPVAGKTGTGVDFRDHWLVGYCPQLTCACWIGNRDYSSTSPSLTANALWHNFMTLALEDEEIVPFPVVGSPEYDKSAMPSATTPAEEAQEIIDGFKPGSLKEGDLDGMYPDMTVRISYEYSDEYEEGVVISQSVDASTDTVNVVVSKGEDPKKKEEAERKAAEEKAAAEKKAAEEKAAAEKAAAEKAAAEKAAAEQAAAEQAAAEQAAHQSGGSGSSNAP